MKFLRNKMEKQIELAKSWFTFAQISATIAGFLVVAFGIFWSNTINLIDSALKLLPDNSHSYMVNINGPICESVVYAGKASLNISRILVGLPIILTGLAIIFCVIGYIKLKRVRKEEIKLRKVL